jgi:dihydroorotate dehydrogenase
MSRLADLGYRKLLRPALFHADSGDAEQVHDRTLSAIAGLARNRPALALVAALCARHRHPVEVAGIRFPGLVGLAAGMDKNGEAVRAWAALGFGHAELGTVTSNPQPGNEWPRLFRLPASLALVNRMGFNNDGAAALAERLTAAGIARGNMAAGIPIGISIGKSKITPLADAAEDYLFSLRLLVPFADYLAINVSSPNTPGLRTLQDAAALRELLGALVAETWRLAAGGLPVPIMVKVSPDLDETALEELLVVCTEGGAEGLIATNTTMARNGLAPSDDALAAETGGLSGAPLAARAHAVVRFLAERTNLPIIAVGGVLSRDDGQAMLDAGASLIQIYTGYVYRGPALVAELNRLEPS